MKIAGGLVTRIQQPNEAMLQSRGQVQPLLSHSHEIHSAHIHPIRPVHAHLAAGSKPTDLSRIRPASTLHVAARMS